MVDDGVAFTVELAASTFSAMAKPTALAIAWHSGPVVVSTAGGVAVLRVTRGAAVQLAEVLQVIDGQVVPVRCSRE